MVTSNKVDCPVCSRKLEITKDKGKLVAVCDCGTGRFRRVYEADDPAYLSDEDILEPAEKVVTPAPAPISKRRKK